MNRTDAPVWAGRNETDLVPKTRIAGNLFLAMEAARTELIAGRIIESVLDNG